MIINLTGLDPYRAQSVVDSTVILMKRAMLQPELRNMIRRKAEALRAEGFFDRFPTPAAQKNEN